MTFLVSMTDQRHYVHSHRLLMLRLCDLCLPCTKPDVQGMIRIIHLSMNIACENWQIVTSFDDRTYER